MLSENIIIIYQISDLLKYQKSCSGLCKLCSNYTARRFYQTTLGEEGKNVACYIVCSKAII